MQEEIDSLEAEQNRHISTVQAGRLLCAQLSTDTSSLRLAMFTRRMRHRNTLHAHVMTTNASTHPNTGIQPPVSAPVAPRNVPMLSRTHSRNSNGNGGVNGNSSSSAAQSDVDLLTQARMLLGDGGNNGSGVGGSVHTRGSTNNSSSSATASATANVSVTGGGGVGGSRSSSRLGHNHAVTGNNMLVFVNRSFHCLTQS